MYTVMVTGGLASGKSTLCKLLCDHGAVSIDLDEINRGLLENDENYKAELVGRFGSEILDETGAIVPERLAERAFYDEQSVKDLNAIAFPYITGTANDCILDLSCAPLSDSKILVIEVPLLTEVPDFAKLADEKIAVVIPSEIRFQRAVFRGMDAQDALRRIIAQPSDADRVAIADTVYENMGTTDDMEAWVDDWWESRMDKIGQQAETGSAARPEGDA